MTDSAEVVLVVQGVQVVVVVQGVHVLVSVQGVQVIVGVQGVQVVPGVNRVMYILVQCRCVVFGSVHFVLTGCPQYCTECALYVL